MVKTKYVEPQVKIAMLDCTDVLTASTWEDKATNDFGKNDVQVYYFQ